MSLSELGSLLKDGGATVIAGVALLISLWNFWHARESYFKNKYYEKQADGCVEIYRALVPLHKMSQAVSALMNWNSNDPNTVTKGMDAISKTYSDWENAVDKWTLHLPKELNDKIFDYSYAHSNFMTHWSGNKPEEAAARNEARKALNTAFREYVQAARRSLHTDQLSKQVLDSLGRPSNQQGTTPKTA